MDKLGVHLQNGVGVSRDLIAAFDMFKRAAEQKHVSAAFHLANCYEKGLGCTVDLRQATLWFERAAFGKSKLSAAFFILTFLQ